MEDQIYGRRAAATRRGVRPVAKHFQKMNILVCSADLPFCSALARAGEVQQLAVSIYWSASALGFASRTEFDAAIIDEELWEEALPIIARWQRLVVIIVRGKSITSLKSGALASVEVLSLPEAVTPELLLSTLADAVQRHDSHNALEQLPSVQGRGQTGSDQAFLA